MKLYFVETVNPEIYVRDIPLRKCEEPHLDDDGFMRVAVNKGSFHTQYAFLDFASAKKFLMRWHNRNLNNAFAERKRAAQIKRSKAA